MGGKKIMKQKKSLVALALIMTLTMVFSLAGCAPAGDSSSAVPTKAPTTAPSRSEGEEIIIGFNQGSNTVDFLRMVGESIAEVCEREGIKLVVTESNFDVEQILPNVDNLLAQGAQIIIDFNVNAEVGGNLVEYCGEKGVPVIGIDVVYTAANGDVSWFFGANNQMAGEVAGEGLAAEINERWGGEIEHLVLFFNSENGDLVRKRLSGMYDGMKKAGIDINEDKVTWIEMGGGGSDTTVAANEKMTDWLAANPTATKIAVGTVNTETGQGVFSATVLSNRQDNVILATNNNGNQTLSAWESPDAKVWLGGTVYYPGKYGEYIVPLALKILAGENPPKVTTMEHEFLTIKDIDKVKEEMGVS